ncbi:MAG: class I SAM-dependent methyltransferase, partial [Starkeya sp.]|nr:class I SAM-dependent methyltransferase [Starkeya sp.]
PGTDAPLRIRLTDKGASTHIARYPRVGAGEAYMDGRMVIEPPHDIRDLVLFVALNAEGDHERALGAKGPLRKLADKAAATIDSFNDRRSARKNAEYTYNLTRRLYELFLDEDRQYTMAYYRDPAISLEQAQLDKKAHIAAKLHLDRATSSGKRVLDIGCGWGGLALYLHRHYDVDVLGVALAPDQIEFCRERAAELGVADRVKFELMDYRDVQGEFDRITSVGLLEHVGTPQYPAFFEHTHRLLKPDGVMFSHCCGRAGPPGKTDAWTRKYIFPGGYIPSLSEVLPHIENAGLIITDIEILRLHYAETLKAWREAFMANRDKAKAIYDERFCRMWEFYLAGSESAFRWQNMMVFHIQISHKQEAVPLTRNYIEAEEKRLKRLDSAPK